MKLLTPRDAPRVVPLGDGRALVIGGWVPDASESPTGTELYDPAKRRPEAAGDLSVGRRTPGAARLAEGRVLVAGGTGPTGEALRTSELWDPATRAWTPAGELPHPVAMARMLALGDGGALCYPTHAEGTGHFPTGVARWSPRGGWTEVPPPPGDFPEAWWEGQAVGLAGDRVLFLGSYRPPLVWDGECCRAAGETLARSAFAAVALADGSALIVGGTRAGEPEREALRWTPAGTMEPAGSLSVARPELPVALALTDGRVAVLAGVDVDARYPKQIDLWDPRTGAFSAEVQVKRGRFGFGPMEHDGALHLIGGATGQGRLVAEVEVVALPEAPAAAATVPAAPTGSSSPAAPSFQGRVLEVDEAQARALRARLESGEPASEVLGADADEVRWVRVTGPQAEVQLFHLAAPAFHARVYDADDFFSLDGEDRLVYQGDGEAVRADEPDDVVTLSPSDLAEGLVVATDAEGVLDLEWLGEPPGLAVLDALRDAAVKALTGPADAPHD